MRTVFLGVVLLAAASGCDTGVDPISPVGAHLFAVHGYVDTSVDTQFVRVEPLRGTADGGSVMPAGVIVGSVDLATGEARSWPDSTARTPSGDTAHLYWSPFRAAPATRYRIEVERDGTAGAVAEATVPSEPVLVPVPAQGSGEFLVQVVNLREVTGIPTSIAVAYEVRPPGSATPIRQVIDYGEPPARQGAVYPLTVFLTRDRVSILRSLGLDPAEPNVELHGVAIRTVLLSPEWSAGQVDPGVRVGRGFFGARAVFELPWRLSPEDARAAGFVDAQPGG